MTDRDGGAPQQAWRAAWAAAKTLMRSIGRSKAHRTCLAVGKAQGIAGDVAEAAGLGDRCEAPSGDSRARFGRVP